MEQVTKLAKEFEEGHATDLETLKTEYMEESERWKHALGELVDRINQTEVVSIEERERIQNK